jgi:hypothetical protein
MLYSGVLENLLKKGFNTQPLEMAAITSKWCLTDMLSGDLLNPQASTDNRINSSQDCECPLFSRVMLSHLLERSQRDRHSGFHHVFSKVRKHDNIVFWFLHQSNLPR